MDNNNFSNLIRKLGFTILGRVYYFLGSANRFVVPSHVYLLMTVTENFAFTRSLSAAIQLKIADNIPKEGVEISDLANRLCCNCDYLYRLLRFLSSRGVFKERKDKIFINNRFSLNLACEGYSKINNWLSYFNSNEQYTQWGKLTQCIIFGQDAYKLSYNKSIFDWHKDNKEDSKLFINAMKDLSYVSNKDIASSYDFSQYKSIIDIGGGVNSLLIEIISKQTGINATIFDTEEVIEALENSNTKMNLSHQIGDFFKFIPDGNEIYLMKSIIHDWNDEKAKLILINCCSAMHENSKLLLIEMLINESNRYQFEKSADIAMMILSGGKERSLPEYQALLNSANLKILNVYSTPTPFFILEAIKIK